MEQKQPSTKIKITPGQAILLVLSKNKDVANPDELKTLYLCGIDSEARKELYRETIKSHRELLAPYDIDDSVDAINNDPSRRCFETLVYHAATQSYLNNYPDGPRKAIFALLSDTDPELATNLGRLTDEQKKDLDGIVVEFNDLYLTGERDYLYERFEPSTRVHCKELVMDFISLYILSNIYSNLPMNAYGDKTGLYAPENRGRKSLKNKGETTKLNAGILRGRDPSFWGKTQLAYLMPAWQKKPTQEFGMPTWGCENFVPIPGARFVDHIFAQKFHPFVNSISGTFLAVVRALLYFQREGQLIPNIYADMEQCLNHIKAMMCAVGYISGGHSIIEYISVLELPKAYGINADDRLAELADALTQHSSIEAMFGCDMKLLETVFEEVISYNDVILAKKGVVAEIPTHMMAAGF